MEKIYRVQMNAKGMPNFSTAEEIVRCRDCVWWGRYGDKNTRCDLYKVFRKADDYCSYGEREGE